MSVRGKRERMHARLDMRLPRVGGCHIGASPTSPASYHNVDYMGSVNIRRGYTSGGYCVLSPWNDAGYSYCILQLNIGYNPISKLEIVSALNSFNLAVAMFYHRYDNRTAKYNPKAYLGAVQTFAGQWNSELGKLGEGNPGSGSWP